MKTAELRLKIKKQPRTVDEMLRGNPQLIDDLERMVVKAAAEERLLVEKEFREELGDASSIFGNRNDFMHGLYEGMRMPTQINVSRAALFGVENKEKLKEALENVSIQDYEHIQRLFESISGADSTLTATAEKAGIPLKKRQTEGEFRLIQLIVNSRYNVDPYARNIVDNYTRYIIGSGIKVSVMNEDVEDQLESFNKQIDFAQLAEDLIKTSFKDGEVALNIQNKVNKAKKEIQWYAIKIFSEEIRGFDADTRNPGRKLTYWWQTSIYTETRFSMIDEWLADIEYFQHINTRGNPTDLGWGKAPDKRKLSAENVILWFQHGDKRELRGRCPLEPVLRDLRLFEDFRINRAILNYERSKVLYIKTVKSGLNRKNATTEIRKSASPKGGTQLTLYGNEQYEIQSPTLHAGDADHDGLLFQYAISTGTCIPVYILGMRADQQNYGAIKNTDTPFNQMITEYAGQFTRLFEKMYRFVIWRCVQSGILPKTVKIQRVARESRKKYYATLERVYYLILESDEARKRGEIKKITLEQVKAFSDELDQSMEEIDIPTTEIPLDIILADSIKPNPLEMAKTAFIERKIGMVSSRTLSEAAGYDWPKELIRMLEERALGIYSVDKGQEDSSNSLTGVDSGDKLDDGSGTANQNSK